jgi:hypothetical protein
MEMEVMVYDEISVRCRVDIQLYPIASELLVIQTETEGLK